MKSFPKSRTEGVLEPGRPPGVASAPKRLQEDILRRFWLHVGLMVASFWAPFLLRFWPLRGSFSGSLNFAPRRDALHTLLFASFKELELRSLNFWNLAALDPSSPGWPPGVAKRYESPGGRCSRARTLHLCLIQPPFLPPPGPAETQCQTHEADTRSLTRTRQKKTTIC